jgi:uncharacterized protein
MNWLIDGNILVALAAQAHPHHPRAKLWMESLSETFHTCAVTEGTFLRLFLQIVKGADSALAWRTLRSIQGDRLHVFLDDGFSYTQVDPHPIQGHRQVTDAWLAELARRHGAKLATLDTGLAVTHTDVAVLIP